MSNEFKDYREFFEKNGDAYIKPVKFGECIFPVTVEEMYQHFKARMWDEIEADVKYIAYKEVNNIED